MEDCVSEDADLHLARISDAQRDNALSNASMPVKAISALSALTENGFTVISGAHHKLTHLEFLVSEKNGGGLFELHTELDGRLRKLKPLHGRDPKWDKENR